MFKKVVFSLVSAAIFFGCKGKNESDGDSYYKDGKYRNAVNSYTAALQKGKISDGFYDSFVIAYASAAKQTAKKNASDDIIRSYVEQIHKNLPKSKKAAAKDSVVLALSEIGVAQVLGGFEYEYTLQGFRNLDSAISIAKRNGGSNAGIAESSRKKAEDAIVKQAIENSDGSENTIAAEYVLLEAEVVAPKNAALKAALNKIRLKNRGDYLLFAEEIIGQRASRLVDKYGYVMSFPILSIGPTSTTGELAVWNSTGNNVDFDVSTIKMVSTDGKEASAKYTGGGWCFMSDHLGKMKSQFKGSVGRLLSELSCQAKVSFSYPSGFVPDYIEVKDKDNNIGRKYFGS
jgi:hypothetical protein